VKVTIVGGAGGVGASTAFNLALMRGGEEIVLVDVRPELITSHVMDLEQVLELSPGCTVRGGDESDLSDADVVVLLAATPLAVGNTSASSSAMPAFRARYSSRDVGPASPSSSRTPSTLSSRGCSGARASAGAGCSATP